MRITIRARKVREKGPAFSEQQAGAIAQFKETRTRRIYSLGNFASSENRDPRGHDSRGRRGQNRRTGFTRPSRYVIIICDRSILVAGKTSRAESRFSQLRFLAMAESSSSSRPLLATRRPCSLTDNRRRILGILQSRRGFSSKKKKERQEERVRSDLVAATKR